MGNGSSNGNGAQAVAERVANSVWLVICARIVSVVLAPFAIWLFIEFVAVLKDMGRALDDLALSQAVQGAVLNQHRIDIDDNEEKIETVNQRVSTWVQLIYTESEANRDNDDQNDRIERLEQFLYRSASP